MAAYVKIAGAIEPLAEAINAGTDQWAFALTNTTPSGTAFVAGTNDLATGGGYVKRQAEHSKWVDRLVREDEELLAMLSVSLFELCD